jgi:hypothetical protein
MIQGFGAAWTPDLPDNALADSDTLAQVAATEYDPAQDDHFEGIDLCGAKFGVWLRNERTYVDLVCGEDDGHYPETQHAALISWRDKPTDGLPAEPACQDCADTGVLSEAAGGGPCSCAAGGPFRDAQAARAAAREAVDAS